MESGKNRAFTVDLEIYRPEGLVILHNSYRYGSVRHSRSEAYLYNFARGLKIARWMDILASNFTAARCYICQKQGSEAFSFPYI